MQAEYKRHQTFHLVPEGFNPKPDPLNDHIERVAVNPEVGAGVSINFVTDRVPATIIKVSASGQTITLQRDRSTRVDSNGMSDAQTYEFGRDLEGTTTTARFSKRDRVYRTSGGQQVSVGRSRYHDFSF